MQNEQRGANAPLAVGALVSVNVGSVRTVTWRGQSVETGIFKNAVAHPVAVVGVNLAGDDQADRRVHGGEDKAVYAYAREDYEWWEEELGRPLGPGTFGENLTTFGVAVSEAQIGERWRVGSAELEVCQPRTPCYKLGMKMDDPHFVRAFAQALRPGAYLRIVREGMVTPADRVDVVKPANPTLTVRDVAEIYVFDRARAAELLAVPALSVGWRHWAETLAGV
jgi:MOSC domain-containing protein YiiM